MNRKIFYISMLFISAILCFSIFRKESHLDADKKFKNLNKIEIRDSYQNLYLKNQPHESFKKLPEKYCVHFGNKDSLNLVTEYYSFSCPHCLNLYKKEFEKIKKNLIHENHVCFVFHPIPLDLLTIQAMICLERLSSEEKCLFLDAILNEADENPLITAKLMQKAMEVINKPIPQLLEQDFIMSHAAIQDAFDFSQENPITVMPSVDINGKLFLEEIPDYLFIFEHIKGMVI